MKLGAAIALEWLTDLGKLRDAARALEDGGVDYLSLASHIVSAAPGRWPDHPDYAYSYRYRELLVLFTYLAGGTKKIHFRSDILILPLYPTMLIARMAADLSDISGGRLELGVGISWNKVEYTALGQDVHRRAERFEEQLELLRLLWTQPRVTYQGRHHEIDDLGLAALPSAPIPLWIGCGHEEKLLRRVARFGDGWMPNRDPIPHIGTLRGHVHAAGRAEGAVAVAGRVKAIGTPDQWVAAATEFRKAGGTDLTIWPPPGAPIADGVAAMLSACKVIAAV